MEARVGSQYPVPDRAAPGVANTLPSLAIRWRNWAVAGVAAVVIALTFVYSFFMDRSPQFDELVLGNPIYMFLHSARMTYPAHGSPDYMVIHPPTHYAIVGTIMRSGLDMFHAAGVPVFVLVALAVILAATGAFAFEAKIGLMFGIYIGIFVWGEYRSVRPDMHVAAAWLCGLIALESGRLDGWKTWRLVLGGFLVTYASGLHYPASFAFVSGVVYAIWIVYALGLKQAWLRLVLMAAAAAVFAIPYIFGFAWPLRREILSLVQVLQKTTWTPPWKLHLETYGFWWQHQDSPGAFYLWRGRPLTALLTAPLFALRIPAAIVAPLLLACFRTTRGIAIAAAPHLAFLLFVAGGQGKNYTNTGYYVPEIALYLAAVMIAAFTLAGKLPGLWGRRNGKEWTALIAASGIAFLLVWEVPNSIPKRFALTGRLAYEDLLREAGHEILGPGAAVGSNSPTMWYHSGAEFYYFLQPDLLYPPDISNVDLPKYFARFDAIGIAPDGSGITWNKQRKSLTEWYADGLLKLRGFVLHDGGIRSDGYLTYLLTASEKHGPVIGYCYSSDRKRLLRFAEAAEGNAVLAVFWGPSAKIAYEPYLNDRTWGYDSFQFAGPQPGARGSDILQIVLIPRQNWPEAQKALAHYHVVEYFPGQIQSANIEEMLNRFDHGRWPLSLPRTTAELEALRARSAGSPERPELTTLLKAARKLSDGIRVSGSPLQWDRVARTGAIALKPGNTYRLTFRLSISAGGVVVNVMSPDLGSSWYQMFRRYPQKLWPESFVFKASGESVVITVSVGNERAGPSSFDLRELKIEPVELK